VTGTPIVAIAEISRCVASIVFSNSSCLRLQHYDD
jgi:hypothetical protein